MQKQLNRLTALHRKIEKQKRLNLNLIDTATPYQDLINSLPILMWHMNSNRQFFGFNTAWLAFTGRDVLEEIGGGWFESIHPDDQDYCVRNFEKRFDDRVSFRIEYRLKRFDGRYCWLETQAVPQYSALGDFIGYLGTSTDISHIRNSKAASDFYNVSHEIIYSTDLNGILLDCNDRFCQITGYTREQSIGQHIRLLKSGVHDKQFYLKMWQKIQLEGYWSGELINRHKLGEFFKVITTIKAVPDLKGQPKRYLAVASDISSINIKQNKLEHLSYYDNLTRLPNRLLLIDRLTQAMTPIKSSSDFIAVLYINLDRFKEINVHYGHEVGDNFLIIMGQQLKNAIHERDTVARMGGDEFVVLLCDLDTEQKMLDMISILVEICNTPIYMNGVALKISASIGVSLFPNVLEEGVMSAVSLIRCADQAMHIAKQKGKNQYHIFDRTQDLLIITRNEAVEKIHNALLNDELDLYYQPKVNLRTGAIVGFEALIRWLDPTRGVLPPSEFLPIIQNHPLYVEVGNYVIHTALSDLNKWQMLGFNTVVSVNVDAKQLNQHDFVAQLKMALEEYPYFKAGSLELEILETTDLYDRTDARQIIDSCQALGVDFALDDFGTGYSSLTYLRQFPVNTIKIDRSFISEMTKNTTDLAIVESMVSLSLILERDVIAEGVETVEQGDMLLKMGCELAQGYVVARPMPRDKIQEWIKVWQSDCIGSFTHLSFTDVISR